MLDRIDAILETRAAFRSDGEEIGRSREGRPIRAFRLGRGPRRVSLIGGCHADEPVGPRLLRHLAGYLASLPERDPLLHSYEWWVLPHVNPDGEERNRAWHGDDDPAFDFTTYLGAVSRELPGDDIEFGFPRTKRTRAPGRRTSLPTRGGAVPAGASPSTCRCTEWRSQPARGFSSMKPGRSAAPC